MATVKEHAHQPLDLASPDAAGEPTAATDATHVSAGTPAANAIQDVGSASAIGGSFQAADAAHTHKGARSLRSDANPQLFGDVTLASGTGMALTQVGNTITVSASGSAVNKVTWADDREKSNVGVTEEVLFQWLVNFDDAGGANVQARLTALAAASAGTGTFNLRVGGTDDTADGTVRATFTAIAAAFAHKTDLGAAFANPGGMQLVKLCASNSGPGGKNKVKALQIAIG